MASNWVVVERFFNDEDQQSSLVVEVQQDLSVQWPKYSVVIGTVRQNEDGENHVSRFIPVRVDRRNVGQVTMRGELVRVQYLCQQAESYILAKSQEFALKEQERVVQRDQERDQYQRQKQGGERRVMRVGKTERDRDRRRGRREDQREG